MKSKYLFTVLIIVVAVFVSSKYPKYNVDNIDIKRLEKSFKEYPSGWQTLEISFRACDHEVTNMEYKIFLNDLKKNKQDSLYKKCLPDTLVWKDRLGYNDVMVEYYFRHPAFSHYPVVGITYEQAKEYCKWLTKVYNANPKAKYKNAKFKVPDYGEWYWSAGIAHNAPLPWYGPYAFDINFTPMANTKDCFDIQRYDASSYTCLVYDYKPNKYGLYNMIGNVAEMVTYPIKNKKDTTGIYTHIDSLFVVGGSWKDTIAACYPSNFYKYKKRPPADNIGFRVFVEIPVKIKNKKTSSIVYKRDIY